MSVVRFIGTEADRLDCHNEIEQWCADGLIQLPTTFTWKYTYVVHIMRPQNGDDDDIWEDNYE
jgi:hypothetical protein